ncbi:hypothetical protein GCM10010145_18130 [Streptomyces ruber]|uniref:DUF5133 domain-containing protein n=2 Tax=Streptomyces TaxID=1883 RepID=A0A918B9J9_9ACTN|nr:DUF5133 domain-containing protein [Streptomyces ruber]GGQ49600.1 hypothetical protein GCM10010145_18130 [Streptomyces ruber]
MLVPDPKVVRQLLTRYATLRIAHAEKETPRTAQDLAEVGNALCALMGVTCVHEAIAAADEVLLAAGRRTGTAAGGERDLPLAV